VKGATVSDVLRDADFIVGWKAQDEGYIERELRNLDPNLFLDKEIDYRGGPVYYVVKHWIGSGHPPVVVLVWKDVDGRPKPLTHEIVEKVKRQEGAMDGLVDRILAEQQQRRERERVESREAQAELTREHLPRLKAAAGRTLPPNWRPRRFGAK
jgi:hypothetical protein